MSLYAQLSRDITLAHVRVEQQVAVEQLVRNTRANYRWRLRYLNIGLGMMFTYGILHSASALLFKTHIPLLSIMQPPILAIAVPFTAIASLRNRQNQLKLNISRQFVFRTGVLIATGTGLLLMGVTAPPAKPEASEEM